MFCRPDRSHRIAISHDGNNSIDAYFVGINFRNLISLIRLLGAKQAPRMILTQFLEKNINTELEGGENRPSDRELNILQHQVRFGLS